MHETTAAVNPRSTYSALVAESINLYQISTNRTLPLMRSLAWCLENTMQLVFVMVDATSLWHADVLQPHVTLMPLNGTVRRG